MKPLIQNIRAPSIGQTIVPLAMITSLLLAFTSNCSGLLAQPEAPFLPNWEKFPQKPAAYLTLTNTSCCEKMPISAK